MSCAPVGASPHMRGDSLRGPCTAAAALRQQQTASLMHAAKHCSTAIAASFDEPTCCCREHFALVCMPPAQGVFALQKHVRPLRPLPPCSSTQVLRPNHRQPRFAPSGAPAPRLLPVR